MKNHPRKTVTIDDSRAGFRIDRLDIGDFSELTRSRIQALIRSGEIRVNGQMVKPSCRLRAGDTVDYHIPDPEPMDLEPLAIPLDILYEDRDIIAVNKPRGMVVHPGAGVSDGTLVHALLHHCSDLSGIGGRQRPGIVHRLDKGTSGVIIAAKNDRAHTGLAAQFAARTMTKKYRALIHGMPHWTEIRVDQPVGRHPSHRLKMTVIPRGRSASTDFILDAYSTEVSLVTARLHTGRTHQIRVHLEYLRHPVLGDTLYAREFVSRLSGAV
ncbi:MAG TPA: RluA family pseudouridine synthase, partial [bacterium]|nr:RluA family pseudouridine synthase [bacterium]